MIEMQEEDNYTLIKTFIYIFEFGRYDLTHLFSISSKTYSISFFRKHISLCVQSDLSSLCTTMLRLQNLVRPLKSEWKSEAALLDAAVISK